jgi:hypothetical protein
MSIESQPSLITPSVVAEPAAVTPATSPVSGTDPPSGDLLQLAREALIAAHPDAIAELIVGATPAELRASIEPARQAYARVYTRGYEQARQELTQQLAPAGFTQRTSAADLAALPPGAKIAAALNQLRTG